MGKHTDHDESKTRGDGHKAGTTASDVRRMIPIQNVPSKGKHAKEDKGQDKDKK